MRLINSDGQAVEASTESYGATVVQVDSGKHVSAVAICAAICGISAVLAAWALVTSLHAEKRIELVNYYLNDPHYRTDEERESWGRFQRDRESQIKSKEK